MIISKTPYRISFFGGGSDYPNFYRKYGGSVLSATIDKHIYITARFLPKFFKHKYRIVWSKIEMVESISQIKHPVVNKILKYLKINEGLEIHYDGDLPAGSGMGSSSCFTVGLMNALLNLKKIKLSKKKLSDKSIFFEQNIMKEAVGSQDQIASSFGGFNKINFNKNGKIKIKKIKLSKNLKILNKNLILIYTGIKRNAHDIAKEYINKVSKSKKKYIDNIKNYVEQGEKILNSGDIDDFGRLLDEAWQEKKKLSNLISNKDIDYLYDQAIKHGALGGKLLGAGGGGFLLMYMKKKYQKKFFKKYRKIQHVSFDFSDSGSQIIFNNLVR